MARALVSFQIYSLGTGPHESNVLHAFIEVLFTLGLFVLNLGCCGLGSLNLSIRLGQLVLGEEASVRSVCLPTLVYLAVRAVDRLHLFGWYCRCH